jgi:hypothetical protein
MLHIGNQKLRKMELKCSGGLLDRLCECETQREEQNYARRLISKYGSLEEAMRQVELERIRPNGRLKVDGNVMKGPSLSGNTGRESPLKPENLATPAAGSRPNRR